MHKRTYYIS